MRKTIHPPRSAHKRCSPVKMKLVALSAGLALGTLPVHAASTRELDIPQRQQWEANYGYCGEVSLISAGLYYGQYISQYDMRAVASPNIDQSREDSQLLLGVNAEQAAARLHLKATSWKRRGGSVDGFLTWVKANVVNGYPVTIGVYYNYGIFDNDTARLAGNKEYDHIVPVTGIRSSKPLEGNALYHPDDVLIFSDNGLWAPNGRPKYTYRYSFKEIQASRVEANSGAHPDYSLARSGGNYGIAVTGIIDRDGETLPVRLQTSIASEAPAMKEGSSKRPASSPITITATVSRLKPGTSYKLYRYDTLQAVPEQSFNGNAAKAAKMWSIKIASGSTYSVKETIRSSAIAVYRAVPVTAP